MRTLFALLFLASCATENHVRLVSTRTDAPTASSQVTPGEIPRRQTLVGALLGAGASAAPASGLTRWPKTYGPRDLRPQELKNCLIEAYRLDQERDMIDTSRDNLNAGRQAIHSEEIALKDASQHRMSNAEIGQFNERVQRHKSAVAFFNARVDSYESKRMAFNSDIGVFNRDCGGKSYYVSDLAEIRGELPFDPAKYSKKD